MPITLLIIFYVEDSSHDEFSPVGFNITEASITQFNLIDGNTLYYNFQVNIIARNSNKKMTFY